MDKAFRVTLRMVWDDNAPVLAELNDPAHGVQRMVADSLFGKCGLPPAWDAFNTETDTVESVVELGAPLSAPTYVRENEGKIVIDMESGTWRLPKHDAYRLRLELAAILDAWAEPISNLIDDEKLDEARQLLEVAREEHGNEGEFVRLEVMLQFLDPPASVPMKELWVNFARGYIKSIDTSDLHRMADDTRSAIEYLQARRDSHHAYLNVDLRELESEIERREVNDDNEATTRRNLLEEPWDEAERLWSTGLVRRHIVRKRLVLAACACARLVIDEIPECEPRPLRAIETAEAWCRGDESLDAVVAATKDASDAFDASAASGASHRRAAFSATSTRPMQFSRCWVRDVRLSLVLDGHVFLNEITADVISMSGLPVKWIHRIGDTGHVVENLMAQRGHRKIWGHT